jgi:F-type H+-transporting ATPase subunit a
MLFLEAATTAAAAAAAHGGEQAAEKPPAFETGSILHFLYDSHLLSEKVLPESVLISLVMIVVMGVAAFLLTRRLSVHRPSKTQAALELIVSALQNMVNGLIGPEGPRYLPVVGTMFIYILVMNLSGVIPLWKSPTANLNVTLSLALIAFLYVQYHGIRANGLLGYLKHFVGEPLWMAPLNILIHVMGELARPVSLCFRLFGNIFGEDTVVAILIWLGAAFLIPVHFPMLLLVIFTSFVQAMVFTMLTCVYLAGFVAHDEGHGHGHDHGEGHGVMDSAPHSASPA